MKRIAVAIVVLAVIVGLGFVGYQRWTGRKQASAADLQTVPVRRGTIRAAVSATGSIAPKTQVQLTFHTAGRVKAVHVQEGDVVEAGQVLAELDTTDLELQVSQAEVSLAISEAKLAQTKAGPSAADLAAARANLKAAEENLTSVQAGPSAADLAAGQMQVEAAREALAALQSGPSEADLAAAEAALLIAQTNYEKLLAGPTPDEQTLAESDLKRAEIVVQQAQAAYDRVAWRPDIGALPQATALQQATLDYQRALANYNLQTQGPTEADLEKAASEVKRAQENLDELKAGPTASQLRSAEAQLAQAEAQLDKLLSSPTELQLENAQAQVEQAQANLDRLLRSPTPEDLDIAEAQVEQARLALEQARLRLEDAVIVAPFAGTVTAVNVDPGQMVSANTPVFQLMDLSSLQVEVAVDEIDIGQVEVGQRVAISLDAFLDQRFLGRVSSIAVGPTVSQGVVSYAVTVEVDPSDFAIRPGMTATTDILVAQRENVLLVPNRAIKTNGRQRVVDVMREGQIVQVPVTLGMRDEVASEVLEGLEEGDEVVVSGAGTAGRFSRFPGGRLFGGRPPR